MDTNNFNQLKDPKRNSFSLENSSKDMKLPKSRESGRNNVHPQSFEYLLQLTGDFGYFQFVMLVVLLGAEIPAAFVAFAPVFVGKQPEGWVCNVNSGNESLVEPHADLCNCPGTLTASDPESSIVTEWNLLCGTSFVSDFITSIQMFGMLTGSLFTSQFSDWYGRKKTYLLVCIIMALGQGLSAAAPSPIYYATARFLCGAGLSGFMGMSTIYPMEFLTPKWRQLCGSVGPWGEGVMLLALIAYFYRAWRQFLWISCIPFLIVISVCPFIPESPRWLLRNRRLEEALEVFKKIHRMNCKEKDEPFTITMELLEKISNEECRGMEQSKFTYLDFFRHKELRLKTLFLMGIWFSWATVYFGISYNINNIKGDPYINVVLLGLADALGYPFALCINNRLGRRKTLITFMSLGTVFLVVLAISDLIYGSTLNPSLVALLCLLGKFGVAGARSAARCLTGESFPTPIRTMGYGISGITAGVGGIIAPQLAYFGSQCWHPLPFAAFALISIGGSAISLLLPETADKTLQEHMELEERDGRKRPTETSSLFNKNIA